MDEAAERPLLNTIRWVSAALVAFGHLFLLVFHPYRLDGAPLFPALLTVLANARVGQHERAGGGRAGRVDENQSGGGRGGAVD